MQCFTGRNTHHPCNRIEDVAQDALEGDAVAKPASHGGKQCVQRGDQGDKADQHRGNDNGNLETCQNVFTQHFEEALTFVQVGHLNIFFTGINTVRVDQRQHDKGAEHVQYQRRNDVFRLQHGHVCTNDGHRHGGHRRCCHGVHTIAGDFAEDIFIGNKVFRLTQNQGADGVKGFQFAHAVDFGEQETNCADNHRQYANMLENTDQRRDKDDWAQHFQEEECQALIIHATKDEVSPFVGKSEQFFEHFGEAFHEAQTNVGVQEEPRQ
ncbi:hypothetical protein HmCmsJML096_01877 [Escherichia coli]|nr:hypothetical protein HmCmsJML096_01877 [Escherichia coli]